MAETLDETIKLFRHREETYRELSEQDPDFKLLEVYNRQLAEWLEELKELRKLRGEQK